MTTQTDVILNRELVNILQNNYNAVDNYFAVYSMKNNKTDDQKLKIFQNLTQYLNKQNLSDMNNHQLTLFNNMFLNDKNKKFLI